MKVPKSFKQVSVSQFQELLPIYKKTLTESDNIKLIDLWCNIIAILADCQLEEVEALPIPKIKEIVKGLGWLNADVYQGQKKYVLFTKGKLYKAPRTAKAFNTARYIEYQTFMGRKGGLIENLHLILATIYQPYFDNSKQTHEERANVFKDVMMADVYPVVFFYTNVWKNSIKRIQEYGLRIAKEKNKEAEELLMSTLREVLENIGDGTVQLTK